MNPEQISIPNCTLDNPVKNSSGKISFCLLPCLHKDERLQVKLPTRFKIYSHPGNGNGNDSFSLGIFNSQKIPGVFQGSGETFECSGDEKDKRS